LSKLSEQIRSIKNEPTARAHLHPRADYPQPAFDKWLAQCKADPSWRAHGVGGCGHDIMVDKPDELTELLIGAA